MTLSRDYDRLYERMLESVAAASTEPEARLTAFWPIAGQKYDRNLLVVGRSVNGWIEEWSVQQLRDDGVRAGVVARLRKDASPPDRCRMMWVSDLAGRTAHPYNTNRSAFWRVLRRLGPETSGRTPDREWPSYLAWTNLYKVSPAAGWNPGGDTQRAQREMAIQLLALEIEAFRPRRVLALTGRAWFGPFADGLRLPIRWRSGLVEGVTRDGQTAWVVAQHPMKKPEDQFVREVIDAFREME